MLKSCTGAVARHLVIAVTMAITLIITTIGISLPAHGASADAQELWDAVKADYQPVDYVTAMKATNPMIRFLDKNEARTQLRKELGAEPTEEQVNARTDDLYGQQLNLGAAFDAVKNEADTLLPRMIDQAMQYDVVNADYLRTNKTQILLGLTYLRHYYSFDIGGKPAWEHMYQEGTASLLDRARAIGASNYEMLMGLTTARQYAATLAPYTGQASITDYITSALAKHAAGTTPSTWLPQATKAIVADKGTTSLFDRYASDKALREQLLPLLAISGPHMYVLSNNYTIQYGLTSSYDGQDVQAMIDRAATEQQAFWDFWERTSTTMNRMGEKPAVVVYDTLQRQPASGTTAAQRWSPRWGAGTDPAVREFITPMRKYMTPVAGAQAQASGTDLRYFASYALTQNGTNTYTHELTHVYDNPIWFNGQPRREGVGPEAYARGLFESENNTPATSEYKPMFNLNTAYELGEDRIQNQSPERFQTPADIKEYMQGVMDVIYSLDAMEAQAALKLDAAAKAAAFNKVSLQPIADNNAPAGYKGDNFAPVSEAEMANVATLNDVIDAGLSTGRLVPKGNTAHQTIRYNEYVTAPLFEPVYAGIQSDTAASGGLTFRRNAYEILAEYGWADGFVTYLSGQYPSDTAALNAIMPEHAGNMATFKKAMFERRVGKFDLMKPAAEFQTAAEMQAAMDQAVARDVALIQAGNYPNVLQGLAGGGTAVRDLKQRIFQSYLRSTNDFRDTIYKAPEPTEERETRTEEIPVEDEIILDNTVLAGTPDEVVNPGQAGERELTYVYTVVNGQRQGEGRLESSRVTREMVKRQIRRGTKAMEITPGTVKPTVTHIHQQDVPMPQASCDTQLGTRSWTVPANSESITWQVNEQGELVATAAQGYIFDREDGTSVQQINFGLPAGEDSCSIELPIPPVPAVDDPCGAGNAQWVLPENTDKLFWSLEEGAALVVAQVGYHFPPGVTTHNYGTAPEKNTEACDTGSNEPDSGTEPSTPDKGTPDSTTPNTGGSDTSTPSTSEEPKEVHKVGAGVYVGLPIAPIPTPAPTDKKPMTVLAPKTESVQKAAKESSPLASTGPTAGLVAVAGAALGLGLLLSRRRSR